MISCAAEKSVRTDAKTTEMVKMKRRRGDLRKNGEEKEEEYIKSASSSSQARAHLGSHINTLIGERGNLLFLHTS